jgi:hypothetical protein
MAITCPNCGKQFDVTLFQFGNTVECDCGTTVDLSVGHRRDANLDAPSPRHAPSTDVIDRQNRLPDNRD